MNGHTDSDVGLPFAYATRQELEMVNQLPVNTNKTNIQHKEELSMDLYSLSRHYFIPVQNYINMRIYNAIYMRWTRNLRHDKV